MNIYFAGSIRGGRKNQKVYFKIIEHLKKLGKVLTEHIGEKKISDKGESLSNEKIYKRDIVWIRQADVVIAEVSTPSLGVGYEIAFAENLGKKILCVYKSNDQVSAMMVGNKNLTVLKYDGLEELFDIIDRYCNREVR